MDVNTRLLRLLRAVANDKIETISSFLEHGNYFFEERLKEWESKYGIGDDDSGNHKKHQRSTNENFHERASKTGKTYDYQRHDTDKYSGFSKQFVDDLQLFDLTPPSSLEMLKKARNRELKKFHPDKFQDNGEKAETAKKIVQIYNAAYERLKTSMGK